MDKKFIFIAIGLIVLGLLYTEYLSYSYRNSLKNQPKQITQATIKPVPSPFIITGSVFDTLGGEPKHCTWKTPVLDYTMYGSVYTQDQKFCLTASVGALIFGVTAYAIGDGQDITAWTSLEPENKQTISYQEAKQQLETIRSSPIPSASQRVTKKPQNSPTTTPFPEIPSSIKTLFDDQQFSCRTWEPDPTKFIIPEQNL